MREHPALRSAAVKVAALGTALAAGLAVATVAGPPTSAATSAPSSLAQAQLVIGPAELMAGPTSYADSNFASLPAVNGTMRGYIANINTYPLQGPDMAHLTADFANPVLRYDPTASAFDHCGAWLQGLWRDPADSQHVVGWYHAETDCAKDPAQQTSAYPAGTVLRSIGQVVSHDGGKTFTKQGRVLSSAATPADGQTIGEGNPTAVVKDDQLYLPFTEKTTRSQLVSMARATPGNGSPGTFGKYDGSGWTTAAQGGTGTSVRNIGGGTASGLYQPGDEMTMLSFEATGGGIRLRYGTDPTAPTAFSAPLIPAVSTDVRPWTDLQNTTQQMFAYPSVAAPTGGNTFGSSFDLVYMYLQPGGVMKSDRYLVRREVSVLPLAQGDPAVLLALTRYRSSGDVTATASLPTSAYAEGERLGYVLTQPAAGTAPLLDCIDGSDKYVAATSCPVGSAQRTTGYVWTDDAAGRAPLYSCLRDTDRFPSTDSGCEGAAQEGIVGYVQAGGAPAPRVSVSGEVHDTTTTPDLATAPPRSGVQVSLLGPDGTAARDAAGDLVAPVTTAADGLYSFTGLPVLSPTQHYTAVIDGLSSGEAAAPGARQATTRLLTADGDTQTALDFGVGPAAAPIKPTIAFSSPARYGTAVTITVGVPGATDGDTVSLQVGSSTPVTRPVSAGAASLVLQAKQAPGSYPVTATYGSATTSATLVIAKVLPTITETFPARTQVGGRASGVVTLSIPGTTIQPPGRVEIKLGKKVIVTWRSLTSGRVSIRLPRLPIGKHTLAIRYAGTTAIYARTLKCLITQR
ncbi:hypothetical protein [Nocardioides montaniterrae]